MDEFDKALVESYNNMAQALLSIEDEGWSLLGVQRTVGDAFTIEQLQLLAEKLTEKTDGNPLLKRGLGLRTSYIFGRGVQIDNFSSRRVESLVMDPQNQSALFSSEAMIINERSNFTAGQFFILADNNTKKLQRIPFKEITGWVSDPDNVEIIRYIRRSWSRIDIDGTPNTIQEWYPVDTYTPTIRIPRIQNQNVNYNKTLFPFMVNRRSGNPWGVPDAFAAYPWAYAYNEYLKDGSRILKSLSMFAWQLKSRTKTGATTAAATIATTKSAGSTAVLGADMELSALPRVSNSVDLSNGKPLAAMVAAALEVSVVALMSDPGTSGAYGVAQTLDVPTTKAMQARQRLWELYLERVMRFFGQKDTEVKWPKMETESSYRMVQSLALAYEAGAIWQDEFRAAVMDELDVHSMHMNAPSQADSEGNVPSQGNSGAVGSMQDNSNDLRDSDS